ncbi:hypothetical protein [Streptomyces xanthophaeus]
METTFSRIGWPIVTLFHPHAHSRNAATEAEMLAIASSLGLRYGRQFPRTGHYIYNISGLWCLDYGHPRDTLQFWPTDQWPQRVRGSGGALIAVSLDHEPLTTDDRMLTGRLALRNRAPREWVQTR